MNGDNRFLFSIIIAVYNTENYLEETLHSIIGQTIGFLQNVEIILVDNASEDGSGSICKEYGSRYPENIKCVTLEKNAGPSGARNVGLAYATGEFINYLDSDDKWGKTALENVYNFSIAHPELNIISCREKRFDLYDSWHIFDYIFQGNRDVVDIFEVPEDVCFAAHALFLRRTLAEQFRFDESLKYCEDMKYVNEIILQEKRYGIVKKAVYYYRERSDGSSQVQNYGKKRHWYFEALPDVCEALLDLSNQLYGECIPYLRWLIMFHLQGRTKAELPHFFSEEECEKYRQIVRNLLQYIDDDIILAQRLLKEDEKINVLRLKYGDDFPRLLRFDMGTFYYGDKRLLRLEDEGCLALELLEITKDEMLLTARASLPEIDRIYKFGAIDEKGNRYDYSVFPLDRSYLDRRVAPSVPQRQGIRFAIPLKSKFQISFVVTVDDRDYSLNFRYGRFFPLTKALKHSHYYSRGWYIYAEDQRLNIVPCGPVKRLKKQLGLWLELARKRKKTALLCHVYAYLYSLLPRRREKWIFADRTHFAGDNAEVLFHFVNAQKNPKIQTIFAVDGASPDFARLQEMGNVISNRSKRYKLEFLTADKLIASYFENSNVYPIKRHEEYIRDIIHSKFIYLQHGVIKDDMSTDNSKLRTRVSAFVTSGMRERASLLEYPYGYGPEEIWLTGLARFDIIYDCDAAKSRKLILIAPTWRNYLEGIQWDKADGLIAYNPKFKETEYFNFYRALLSDERLLDVMRKYGYRGIFRLHPTLRHFTGDFVENDVFTVEPQSSGYRKELEEVALLVTDYSSTVFDYAYVRKPCVYMQFDAETFYQGHTYMPGYFDYEKDGFGPVCCDYESSVQTIIEMIKSGCVMEGKYRQRADAFFAFQDGKSCERIYHEILELEERRGPV